MKTRTLLAEHPLIEVLISQLIINNRRPRNCGSLELMREILKHSLFIDLCLGINRLISRLLSELLQLSGLLALSFLAETDRLRLLFVNFLRERGLVLLIEDVEVLLVHHVLGGFWLLFIRYLCLALHLAA